MTDDGDTKAIERLRASKQASERLEQDRERERERERQEQRTAGHDAGRRWAEQRAGYDDLCRLTDDHGRLPFRGLKMLSWAVPLGNNELRQFCFGDDRGRSDIFVEAFIEGAIEYFTKVRDQL
jgi:hypothetical protein